MPITPINVGTAANNGTGDPLRLAFQKANANDTYLKIYADNLIQGLKWKQRVLIATTANVVLSGEQTIDGILTNASRILVKDQTNKPENGLYTTAAGGWVRTADADTGEELVNATVSVTSGTANANTNWTSNAASITLGTTDIVWVRFQGADGVDQGAFDAAIALINSQLDTKLEKGTYTGTAKDLENLANTKETPTGAQAKADIAEFNAKAYADGIGGGGTGTGSKTEIVSFNTNYQSGLTFFPAAQWREDGILKSDSRQVTLAAASPSLDRFDLFAINLNTDQIEIIQGTAANPAVEPSYDPLTYLAANFVSIKAGATTPENVVGVNIWTEGSEWSTTGAGASFDFANIESVASGTYAIKVVTPLTNGQALPFTAPVPKSYDDGMEIAYKMKNITGGLYRWLVAGTKSNGRQTSLFIDAPFNYSASSTVYQSLSVAIPSGVFANITKISLVSGVAGFQYYLDDVKLVSGGGAVTGDFVTVTNWQTKNDSQDAAITLKLNAADYNDRFKGVYLTLAALNTAHPTADAGDTAQVNETGSVQVKNYIWDAEDSAWVLSSTSGGGATNTDQLPEGTSNLYFTTARVLATVLTGLSLVTGGAIVSTDTVLAAFGKIQKQINDNIAAINGKQATLVSGTNIKTLNGSSLLGSGDFAITEEQILGTATENTAATGTLNQDLNTFSDKYLTLTGNTTLTFSNTPASGKTIVKTMTIKSTTTQTLALPAGYILLGEFANTGVENYFTFKFSNFPTIGLKVVVTIDKV